MVFEATTMKEQLEKIWLDNKCRCPMNLVWWHLGKNGFGYRETETIWYSKGKRTSVSNVAAKRLEVLKAMLEAEKASKAPDQRYIDDLLLSIQDQELIVKTANPEGYRMIS